MVTIPVLTNPTPIQLEFAVEENLFDLFRAMARVLPGSEIVEGNKLCYHLTFPSNPMFKGVWRTQLASDEVEAAIKQTIAWFKEHNASFFFWWTGPRTQPEDLGERLMAHGLLSMEAQMEELAHGIKQTVSGAPGMVANLKEMNEAVLSRTPAGFVIEEVRTEAALLDFKQIFVETYEIPEWAGQAWVDATLKAGIGQTPWKMYVGYLHDEPIATNMLFNGGGVASVYAVATLPSAQRKGIGAAITLKPLLKARAMGYSHAVLFSTEMGIRVYERIGFELTNARINRYLWRNEN